MRLVQSLDDEKLSLVIHGRKALDSFKRKHLNHCFILRINFFQEINHSKPFWLYDKIRKWGHSFKNITGAENNH